MMLTRIVGCCLVVAYEGSAYFLSFLGPAIWVFSHRTASPPRLLAMALLGYVWAGVTFLLLLVLTKQLLLRRIPTGHVSVRSRAADLWFFAVSLMCVFDRSPFRAFTEINIVAPLFFRGMGGRLPLSSAFGMRAVVFEPWFLEMGNNVGVGSQAVILGHVAVGEELILGNVVIGNNVTVGMRSVIFPEVRIGNNVRIGAGAIVTRGTVVPDGETWVGVPARPLRSRSQ